MIPLLDSRQLLAFCTVARTGRFTRAAEQLFLTQSAISHAIRGLERDLGCSLFERGGRQIRLTSAGEVLRAHAERILADMAHARSELEPGRAGGPDRLRIGASAAACQHLLPPALHEFRRRFPQCELAVEPGDWEGLLEMLLQDRLDYALTLQPGNRAEFSFTPVFEDELNFAVSPTHPWARRPAVTLATAARETLIVYPRTSLTFRLVSAYFRKAGVPLRNVIEAGSMDLIKELAKNGTGVGVLAPWIAREELRRGELVAIPLGPDSLRRSWGMVSLRRRRALPGEKEFIQLVGSLAGAATMAPVFERAARPA